MEGGKKMTTTRPGDEYYKIRLLSSGIHLYNFTTGGQATASPSKDVGDCCIRDEWRG